MKKKLEREYNKLLKQQNDFTRSDLQGSVMYIVTQAFPEFDMSTRAKRITKYEIENTILDGLDNNKNVSSVKKNIKKIKGVNYGLL